MASKRKNQGRKSSQATVAVILGILATIAILLVAAQYVAFPGGSEDFSEGSDSSGVTSQPDVSESADEKQQADNSSALPDSSQPEAEPPVVEPEPPSVSDGNAENSNTETQT